MTIEWKPGPEPNHFVAYIGQLSIGAVYSFRDPAHWYGTVEGVGRIGSCESEQDAKAEVERIWNKGGR